jgi:hypothetical protein
MPGRAGSRLAVSWSRPRGDGVPGLADLPGDQVVELVAPVGGGGQAQPAACRDLPDGVVERRCRDVVAFVGDDQAVSGGQLGDVGAAGQRLQCGDVDLAAELRAAAALILASHLLRRRDA